MTGCASAELRTDLEQRSLSCRVCAQVAPGCAASETGGANHMSANRLNHDHCTELQIKQIDLLCTEIQENRLIHCAQKLRKAD